MAAILNVSAAGGLTGVVKVIAPESARAQHAAARSARRTLLLGVLGLVVFAALFGAAFVRRKRSEDTHRKLAAEWQQKPGRLVGREEPLGDADGGGEDAVDRC